MGSERRKLSLRAQPAWIKAAILQGNAFHYRQKNRAIHNAINLSVFGLILLGLVTIGLLGRWLSPLFFIPIGAIGFGILYFALFILTVHEASHNMFILLKNRRQSKLWNHIFGWLVCIPLGIDYVQHWEVGHHIHHVNPCCTEDPQNCPSTLFTGKKLFQFVAKTLVIPGFIQFSAAGYHCPATEAYEFNGKMLAGQITAWAGFIAISVLCGNWPLPVAAFLGLQVLATLNLFKIAMEHGGEIALHDNPYLRSTSSFFPLRSLLMPLNISLHFEHHLNDSVPWYDLPKYHCALKEIVPAEVRSHVFTSNAAVWKRITEPMPTGNQ